MVCTLGSPRWRWAQWVFYLERDQILWISWFNSPLLAPCWRSYLCRVKNGHQSQPKSPKMVSFLLMTVCGSAAALLVIVICNSIKDEPFNVRTKHFEVKDQAELLESLKAFLALPLVTTGTEGLNADYIPMLGSLSIAGKTIVFYRGTSRKANTTLAKSAAQRDVLVIFQGGGETPIFHHWYPSKQTWWQKPVPTWNYQAVLFKGSANSFMKSGKLALLEKKLTNTMSKPVLFPLVNGSDAPQELHR